MEILAQHSVEVVELGVPVSECDSLIGSREHSSAFLKLGRVLLFISLLEVQLERPNKKIFTTRLKEKNNEQLQTFIYF